MTVACDRAPSGDFIELSPTQGTEIGAVVG